MTDQHQIRIKKDEELCRTEARRGGGFALARFWRPPNPPSTADPTALIIFRKQLKRDTNPFPSATDQGQAKRNCLPKNIDDLSNRGQTHLWKQAATGFAASKNASANGTGRAPYPFSCNPSAARSSPWSSQVQNTTVKGVQLIQLAHQKYHCAVNLQSALPKRPNIKKL